MFIVCLLHSYSYSCIYAVIFIVFLVCLLESRKRRDEEKKRREERREWDSGRGRRSEKFGGLHPTPGPGRGAQMREEREVEEERGRCEKRREGQR